MVSLSPAAMPRLKVSENHRFLVTEDGRPFFWLGDTAWELFHRLNREEASRYLETARKRDSRLFKLSRSQSWKGTQPPTPMGMCL